MFHDQGNSRRNTPLWEPLPLMAANASKCTGIADNLYTKINTMIPN